MILVISSKTTYADKRLVSEAKAANVDLKIVSPGELRDINPADFRCLFVRNPFVEKSPKYLSEVVNLAKTFKQAGKKVFDSSVASGDLAKGKWVDYQKLLKAYLPIPRTEVLQSYNLKPKTYPLILKWIYGFKGKHVYLVSDEQRFRLLLKKYPKEELMLQEFVPAQYEYKIITLGYKALPVVLRFNIKDSRFRVNPVAFESVPTEKLPKRLIALAELASKVLGREMAKVDILENNGKFYILEVNRFPGLQSFETLTKYNVAREFLEYLQK